LRLDASRDAARAVVEHGCRLGVAFDGDGDRAISSTRRPRRRRRRRAADVRAPPEAQGQLQGNGIVATVMSNIGLEIALREAASRWCAARSATST
jgi:phosphoglucosamine mutase